MDKGLIMTSPFPGHNFVPLHLFRPGKKLPDCPKFDEKYAVDPPKPRGCTVEVWTNGSALNNGTESCSARSGWVSSLGMEKSWRLVGFPVINNVAEVVAIITAISTYQYSPVLIHTDSSFIINLCLGGLLELETAGGPQSPG
jgi:RNase H